ncbi:MAG: hypothetical protein C0P72_007990 [Clostridia bacterium]
MMVGKKRVIFYLMILAFNIRISVLIGQEANLVTDNLRINDIYLLFSRLIYFALYYVPIFLIIISHEDILNHTLILVRFKNIDIWWKEKIKLLLIDTVLYVILLELPIIVTAVMYIGVPHLLEAKILAFMLGDFIIKYLIFLPTGIIYLISSFISKRRYVGFLVGFFTGSLDYILTLIKLDRYAMTTAGILLEFIFSFKLPTIKFLLLSLVYCSYLAFLSLFLFLMGVKVLEKTDIRRSGL